MRDHLSQFSKEFEHYFPTTKDPKTGKEWIRNPFVNKPGEQTLSMLEEDHLLEIVNDRGLWPRVCLRQLQTSIRFGLKSWLNSLRLPQKH